MKKILLIMLFTTVSFLYFTQILQNEPRKGITEEEKIKLNKVKNITILDKHYLPKEFIDEYLLSKNEKYYDKNCKLVLELKYYSGNEFMWRTEYKYNNNGFEIEILYHSIKNKYILRYITKYDSANRIIEKISSGNVRKPDREEISSRQTWEYDSIGNCCKTTEYSGTSIILLTKIVSDEKKHCIEETAFNKDGLIGGKTIIWMNNWNKIYKKDMYCYKDIGKHDYYRKEQLKQIIAEREKYGLDKFIYLENSIIYNAYGQIISDADYNYDGKLSRITTYKYDRAGNLIETKYNTYNPYYNVIWGTGKTNYIIDKKGNCIQKIEIFAPVDFGYEYDYQYSSWFYKYNQSGNISEEKHFTNKNGYEYLTNYEYEYYP